MNPLNLPAQLNYAAIFLFVLGHTTNQHIVTRHWYVYADKSLASHSPILAIIVCISFCSMQHAVLHTRILQSVRKLFA